MGFFSTTHIQVLLAEQRAKVADHVAAVLQQGGGAAWVEVTTLAAALEALRQTPPDVVILGDLAQADALELLMAAAPQVPVVIHAMETDVPGVEEALARGAQDYLVMGQYTPPLLIRSLRFAMARHAVRHNVKGTDQHTAVSLQYIIEKVADGLMVLDTEGSVVLANPAACGLLNQSPDTLVGRTFGVPVVDGVGTELDLPRPDGTVTTVEMQAAPLVWEGRPARVVSLRDITAHKHLEAALYQAKAEAEALVRIKERMLVSINHDVRTPLTAIIGFAETLQEPNVTEAQRLEFARIIESGGKKLLQTVNSVIDYTRLQEGTFEQQAEPVAVGVVAQEVTDLLRPLAEQKGLALRYQRKTTRDTVLAYPAFVRRILENLVGNAIKYTQEGEVVVTVDVGGDRVYLVVHDTGVGIDPAFLPYLFELYRVEARHAGAPSDGVGLAITKQLVEHLEGRIQVSSERGVGSIFTVTLPFHALGRQTSASMSTSQGSTPASQTSTRAPKGRS